MTTTLGALHKIGRFRNVPTVGTFVNKLKSNLLINVPTVGTFRKQPILYNAPLVTILAINFFAWTQKEPITHIGPVTIIVAL